MATVLGTRRIRMPDNLTVAQRSYTMSRIQSADTGPEVLLRRLLRARGIRFRVYVRDLPGRPDFVFPAARTVVFVNGDFWHGWRFPLWRAKLGVYWRKKIAGNRARDRKVIRRLRRRGWLVLRLWEHQLERNPAGCVDRVQAAIASRVALEGGAVSVERRRVKVGLGQGNR